MGRFADFFVRLESVVEKMCHLVEKAAPLAEAIAPLTGPYAAAVAGGAGAAELIATATDKAIEQHQAAGGTTESAVASLATIAQAVAESSVTSDATASKINTILGTLGTV